MSSRPHPAGSNRIIIWKDAHSYRGRPQWTWSCLHSACTARLYESYGRAVTWRETLGHAWAHAGEFHQGGHLPHDL